MNHLEYRLGKQEDVAWLAEMNQQLIRDEKHRNRTTLSELEKRMSDFLRNQYSTVIVSCNQVDIGYALYRQEEDWIYLRQLFVKREMRRKGVARAMIEWLRDNPWSECQRIRVEVLVGNLAGINFWRSVGFKDYCITMEMENQ